MSEADRQKATIVTGSSSGIGYATSLLLARNGFQTYATMRKLEGGGSKQVTDIAKHDNLPLQVIQLDIDASNLYEITNLLKLKGRFYFNPWFYW